MNNERYGLGTHLLIVPTENSPKPKNIDEISKDTKYGLKEIPQEIDKPNENPSK